MRLGVAWRLTAFVPVALAVGAIAPTAATSAAIPIARPNQALVLPALDYGAATTGANGKPTMLALLSGSAVQASVADERYLTYARASDLGGFEPAPVGQFIVVTRTPAPQPNAKTAQIPLLGTTGNNGSNGQISSFGFVAGLPDSGATGGLPKSGGSGSAGSAVTGGTVATTTSTTIVVPSNTAPSPLGSPSTTLPKSTHATTSTTRPETTTTTSTATSTTTTTIPQQEIGMTNDHDGHAVITATNMAPGQTASELLTIANDGTVPFALSVQGRVDANNALTSALTLVITRAADGQIIYDGPLATPLVSVENLPIGAATRFRIDLQLSRSTGNDLQQLSATLDLDWTGQG